VVGLNPQVVTETLWALMKRGEIPKFLCVLTTAELADRLKSELIGSNGRIAQLGVDWGVKDLAALEVEIRFPTLSDGTPVSDMTASAEMEAFADLAVSAIETVLAGDWRKVDVCITGARKTMSFYLGYALTILGDQRCRLLNVMTDPTYEGLSEGWYPSPAPKLVVGRTGKQVDLSAMPVELAEIPILTLSELGRRPVIRRGISYTELVKSVRDFSLRFTVKLAPATRTLKVVGYGDVRLQPRQALIYACLIESHRDGNGLVHLPKVVRNVDNDWVRRMSEIARRYSLDDKRTEAMLEQGMDGQMLSEAISRLRKTLFETFGEIAEKFAPRQETIGDNKKIWTLPDCGVYELEELASLPNSQNVGNAARDK
jgi:CRISPR-associated protein (TIGR02584 family)